MTPRRCLLGLYALGIASLLHGGCAPSTTTSQGTTAAVDEPATQGSAGPLLGEWALRGEEARIGQLVLRDGTFEYRGGLTTYRGDWRLVAHDGQDYEIELSATTRSELGDHPTERVEKGGQPTPTVQQTDTVLEPPLVWGYRVTVADGRITSVNTESQETATWLDDRPEVD